MIVHLRHLIIVTASIVMSIPSAFAGEAQDALVEQGVVAFHSDDYQRAKSILIPLAEAGHPKAMNMVGKMHDFGKGFPKNTALGCDWYERSAKVGYVSGQTNIGTCFFWGDGRPKNVDIAIMWNHMSAEQGGKLSQMNLAAYYVDLDRDQYLYWVQKAAAQGSTKAKALMWGNGDRDLVPDLHWTDLVCVVVMHGWLEKPYDYCD